MRFKLNSTGAKLTQLTTLNELERYLILLGEVEVSDALFVSCYLNLEDGAEGGRAALTERANLLRSTLPSNDLAELGRALCEIDSYLAAEILPDAKGVAIFARSNFRPFLLAIQFAIPVPSLIAVCPTPSVQPLVKLRDCYLRHDGQLTTASRSRILDWM